MSLHFSIKQYTKSLAAKIIVTCLLACAATFVSLYISRLTFNRILSTVNNLSKPNEKIQLVNSLFRDVVQLDQLQRNQTLATKPAPYNPFLNESHHLQLMLDSLRDISIQNNLQVARVDSMKKILYQRDLLFLRYIKLRTGFVQNDTLTGQVKHLTGMIEKARLRMDNNFITTSRTTTTIIDTLKEEEEKQSLWNRVFVKRKPQPKQVQKRIAEELKVRVDTLAIGKNGDSLAKLGAAITKVETSRTTQREQLIKRQAELNRTGAALITQLINILNDIEESELAHAAQQNDIANHLVNKSVIIISGVLIIFVLVTIVLIFFIFTDLSRSNRYRKELIAAKEEAEQAGLVKQRFLANMSHELRTPLQIIIGISEQIKGTMQPKQQDLENIHQSSLYLLQIVNEVLDYSRIISGKYVLENRPFNMQALLHDVQEMIQIQATVNGLTLNYSADVSGSNYYIGDAFRLKQILFNLLGNAVKFTEEGDVSLHVKEEQNADRMSLFTFTVSDTGIGINKDELSVVFNQFEQGSNLNKKQGTGLGLSIVKALTDIQHGSLNVQSEPGKGTTFTVTLAYPQTEAPADESVTSPSIIDHTHRHVWVVDDDPFILQLCDTILNKHNIPHTCFSSANRALATPFPESISIVFLDIRMPEIDGITLCNKLKERQVPVLPQFIALTAQALPDEREAILQKGFDGLVMKPFLEQDFINAVYKYSYYEQGQSDAVQLTDLDSLYRMAGGDQELIDKSLDSFITETKADMHAAALSIAQNDANGLADAMHKLAGRCGQLGITELAHRLRSIEITLRELSSITTVSENVSAIFDELSAAIATIQELRSKGNFPA